MLCYQSTVVYLLKPIPFKVSLRERDLASRREQLLFQKLWRYIEARVLSIVPDGIDRLGFEWVAFDLLAGTKKQRTCTIDKRNCLVIDTH